MFKRLGIRLFKHTCNALIVNYLHLFDRQTFKRLNIQVFGYDCCFNIQALTLCCAPMNWNSAINFAGGYDGFEEWEPEPEPPKAETLQALRVERWERLEARRALMVRLRRKYKWKAGQGN